MRRPVKHMQNVEKKVLFLEEENPLLKEQYCFHPEVIQEEQKCSKSETLTQDKGLLACAPLLHMDKDNVYNQLRSCGFELSRVLGQGAFGKVILAKCGKSEYCAMKIMKKEVIIKNDQMQRLKREIGIMRSIKDAHPFILNLVSVVQTKDYLFIVTEFCPGGSLFTLIKDRKVTDSNAPFYLACVVLGLDFLHSRKIVHRDIKEGNMLVDSEGYVRIADFGLSRVLCNGVAHSRCGTPGYVAPELLQGMPYSTPVDWWAVGVMAYVMLIGILPFRGRDKSSIRQRTLTVEPHIPLLLASAAADLIRQLRAYNIAVDDEELLTAPQRSLTSSEQALFTEF